VGDVLAMAGWPAGTVTRDGLDWLRDRLIKAQRAENLHIDGMKEDRRAVIGGGLSVLRAVFDLLDINEMHAAQGALRHGALYDLLDREQLQTDVRATTVQRLMGKFEVDAAQARRVGQTAGHLFRRMLPDMPVERRDRLERKLDWAARLHEIGAHISHSDYHKHGAYILDNADAPGFALAELHRLGQLVLGHRGKLRKLEADFEDALFVQQLLVLRLAVILCHARRDPDLEGLQLACSPQPARRFTLAWRTGWAEAWPQSAHLLREEIVAWQKTPWSLRLEAA
jgi:exopolyphosphatase/guanosine-5'-triphosphate,3'-diphosphate pyrophosphatase